MKLYDLIKLRNDLSLALETAILNQELEKNHARLLNLSLNIDSELSSSIAAIAADHKEISNLYQRDIDRINKVISTVQEKINFLSTNFFAENYQLELNYPDADTIRRTRSMRPGGEPQKVIYIEPLRAQDAEELEPVAVSTIPSTYDEFEQKIKQRINLISNWKYPALEIGCRDGGWTKFLVASDPLYIADVYEEFLSSAVAQFPSLYQGRVRKYLIQDFYNIPQLPENQFGLIFSYNHFNYLSMDSIKQFLIQSTKWLRPGGKIIFTYNNADLPAAAAYAENYFMTYVPKSMLIPLAESLGFETIFSFDVEPAYSLIEFKKPGQLTSIKASQAVGEIKIKP